MNQSPINGSGWWKKADFIRPGGWVIFMVSIFSALFSKGGPLLFAVLFWGSVSVMIGISIAYGVACCASKRWRSRTFRIHFDYYIAGATAWILLILLLNHLYRLE